MEVPQKIKYRITTLSSNSSTGHLLKEYEKSNLKGHMHCYVYGSTIYSSHIMEAAQASIDR